MHLQRQHRREQRQEPEGEAQGHAHRNPEPGVELTRPIELDGGCVAELNKLHTVVILDAVFVAL